jgi:hypothetical protein
MITNNPRIRSLLLGSIGGLAGALLAQVIIGTPSSLGGTAGFGIIVGALIGVLLGAGEFLLIGNTKRFGQAAVLALAIGAVGGGIGASFGQVAYQMSSDPPAVSEGDAVASGGSIFSPEMERRIRDAGGASGEIEIGLIWQDYNDLDLHVVEPSGNRIYYGRKRSSLSGGTLDIDRNANCGSRTREPVEHIVWADTDIPTGDYKIQVHYFAHCSDAPMSSNYTVQLKIGDEIEVFEGVAAVPNQTQDVHTLSGPFAENAAGDTVKSRSSGNTTLFQIIGWVIFGILLGVATGAPKKSGVAIRNAGLGGALGGIVGGILFVQINGLLGGANPVLSLAIGMTILGASIGFLIALVEGALSAVLKITSGVYNGREILIVHDAITIGRDEVRDEYIGADSAIASQHAEIRKGGGSHAIIPVNGVVTVNGQQIGGSCQLSNGDQIILGKTNMIYHWRAASVEPPGVPPPIPAPPISGPPPTPVPPDGRPPEVSKPLPSPPPPPPRKPPESRTPASRPSTEKTNRPPPPPPPIRR